MAPSFSYCFSLIRWICLSLCWKSMEHTFSVRVPVTTWRSPHSSLQCSLQYWTCLFIQQLIMSCLVIPFLLLFNFSSVYILFLKLFYELLVTHSNTFSENLLRARHWGNSGVRINVTPVLDLTVGGGSWMVNQLWSVWHVTEARRGL